MLLALTVGKMCKLLQLQLQKTSEKSLRNKKEISSLAFFQAKLIRTGEGEQQIVESGTHDIIKY